MEEGVEKKIDISQPVKVSYCIPTWLRDEQIRVNMATVAGRLDTDYGLRDEPIAVVAYGPSLQETWEQIRAFKRIITCSGAHEFLIARGIVPTWHCDVDPRAHKVKLLGEPHPDVEYLIASACHPGYFERLRGFNVKLWHVFDPSDEGIRLLPPGEWALSGGCSAGLRAMSLARFMGFRAQHVFGMDGNYRDDTKGGSHAGAHPNNPKPVFTVDYGGRTWHTTPAFAEAARQVAHEMDALADVEATFHGDGLVQAMMKDYARKPAKPGTQLLAFNKPTLISDTVRALNAQLHRDRLDYGVGGGRHAATVLAMVRSLRNDGVEFPSVLDYGCGKGYLAKALPFPIWSYDPAIPAFAEAPRAADLVVCTDVLEHIEPDRLVWVLSELRRLALRVGYFVVHLGAAGKTYADGRNTHLIQKPPEWWKVQLKPFFKIALFKAKLGELHVVVAPRAKPKVLVPEAKIEVYQTR